MRAAGHQGAAALLLLAAVLGTRAEVIDDILGSLTDAVSFLEREREQVNLDGLVGFIMLQGRWTLSGLRNGRGGVVPAAGARIASVFVHVSGWWEQGGLI